MVACCQVHVNSINRPIVQCRHGQWVGLTHGLGWVTKTGPISMCGQVFTQHSAPTWYPVSTDGDHAAFAVYKLKFPY